MGVQVDTADSATAFAVRFQGNSSTLTFPNVAGLPAEGMVTLSVLPSVEMRQHAGAVLVYAQSLPRRDTLARCDLAEAMPTSGSRLSVTCPFKYERSLLAPDGEEAMEGLVFMYESHALGMPDSNAGVDLDWWSLEFSPSNAATP